MIKGELVAQWIEGSAAVDACEAIAHVYLEA